MGHVGSKLGHKATHRKLYEFSSRHSFDPIFMKLYQDVCHHLILTNLKLDHCGSKTRYLGQSVEKLVYTLKGTVFI